MEKENWDIEQEGYEKGINPLMGRFEKTFKFPPVPYGSRQRNVFKEKIIEDLQNIEYHFFGEVKLEIILHLSEQKRYETPELADLDNYAKLICDSLKGSTGILIDDCQIQSLNVSWIDTNIEGYFEVIINGHPDEYLMKPLKIYEMSNTLFYPISNRIWTIEGIRETVSDINFLIHLDKMTFTSKKYRHTLRKSGTDQDRAYQLSHYLSPVLTGFHKTRVIDSGFEIIELKDWKGN